MEQEHKNQHASTVATTTTMSEIQKWLSESTFDEDIRQRIGIFCKGYSTFKQIGKAYPKGSGEFLQELKDKQNDKLIGTQRVAVGILFEKIEQSEQSVTTSSNDGERAIEQKDNSVIVKEYYLPDGNFKKNIAAYCKHHAVFGSILRVVVSNLLMFKLVNPDSADNRPCYLAPPTDIRHRLRVEGTQSNIDAMFRDVFTNVNNLKESDLIEIDAKHFDTLPTHGGFIIEQTDTDIRRDDSSGKKTKKSEFTARSQSSGESQQWAFKQKVYVRDDGKCRLHGDNYNCIHLGRMEEAKAGHISGVNADRISSVDEKRLTFDAFNGYLFCHKAEHAWSIYLFTVDVVTGYAIFAPEFPYKLMNIKKGARIKIGLWDRNDFKGYKFDTKKAAKTTGASEHKNENANESKDTESTDHESKEESNESDIDMRMIVEPPRYLLEKRHEFYIASRKQKYEEDKELKHFCDYCGKGFDEESKKLDHTRDAHKDGKEVEDIQQWHFYVTKLPLCSCTKCAQMNA